MAQSPSYSRSPKIVLITGAEGALGGAVARKFSASGVKVIGTYHRSPGEDASIAAHWIRMDVSDAASVKAGVSELASKGLEPEALVHCAGGFRYLAVEQTDDANLDFLIDTNLRSAFLVTRELLPRMKEKNFGRIVFISSRATLQAPSGMAAYAASKAGINALTASLADEVRKLDINVNAVLPTVIDTPANRKDMPGADVSAWVSTEALSEVIFSLTQPWGKPIHGALIPVSGRL